MSEAIARPAPRWWLVLLGLVFAYLLALRLWFDLAVPPMGDEAYYWMWGQHLSWSYFDHPPLDGWLQGLNAALLGWSNLSVRLLTWLSLAGTLGVLWLWSKLLAPDDRLGWFVQAAVLYLTIPIIFMMSAFAYHDHLLIFFVVATTYAFHSFARDWEAGIKAWRKLFAAAALLGLAVLTKYNGVFLGLGIAAWIAWRPKLRALYLTPQLWLAALLAVLIQAPVFYWNLTEGWASLRYHFTERDHLNWGTPSIRQVVDFLGAMVASMSPVLFLALLRLPFLRRRSDDDARSLSLAGIVYVLSTLAWAIIALYIYIYVHWNIVAYAVLAPVVLRLVSNRLAMLLHIAFGLVVITVGLLNYTVGPMKLLGFGDTGAAASFGWPELAAEVAAQHKAHPEAFLAAARYTHAAQLGFQLHDADIAALNHLPSQNDYWWNAAAHAGQDALIVADAGAGSTIAEAAPRFASVEKLEDVPVVVRGQTVWSFEIWLGRGFKP
jgi:4-amino-4-deoxy-L-arabinose transferase-like glycosyltransferase